MKPIAKFQFDHFDKDAYKHQWRMGQVMLALMFIISAMSLYLAWRIYQPLPQIDFVVKQNNKVALVAEKINSLTVTLQYAQLKLVEDFNNNGDAALLPSSFSRQQLQSSMEALSVQVDSLNSLLSAAAPGIEMDNSVLSHARTQVTQIALAKLSHQLEVFQGLSHELVSKLSASTAQSSQSSKQVQVKAQRAAVTLNQASEALAVVATQEAGRFIIQAQNDESLFLKALLVLSGFAVFLNAVSLSLLGRSLKTNAALARELSSLASSDPLTGLLNRRALLQHLRHLSYPEEKGNEKRQADAGDTCLVLIDLDHFKQFNDCFGHVKGDEHLKFCAQLWLNNVRTLDSVARMGGEEFAIVIPLCSAQQALFKLGQMQTEMPVGTSFSAGVAVRLASEPFEDWYHRADVALYRAKSQGRAQAVIAKNRE